MDQPERITQLARFLYVETNRILGEGRLLYDERTALSRPLFVEVAGHVMVSAERHELEQNGRAAVTKTIGSIVYWYATVKPVANVFARQEAGEDALLSDVNERLALLLAERMLFYITSEDAGLRPAIWQDCGSSRCFLDERKLVRGQCVKKKLNGFAEYQRQKHWKNVLYGLRTQRLSEFAITSMIDMIIIVSCEDIVPVWSN